MSITPGQPALAQDINDALDTKVSIESASDTPIIATDDTTSRTLANWFKGQFTPAGYAGIVFDGNTDCGDALNAYIQTTPNGATIFLPGSIFTSVTILIDGARTLRSSGSLTSGINGGSSTVKIIGSSSVDPVVKCDDPGSGLSDLFVTRNGTPTTGARGVLVAGHTDHTIRRVYVFNHDIGIQIGQTAANGGGPLNTKMDNCQTWNCATDQVYLINCPETLFFHHRFGANGFTESSFQSSVHIDGDENTDTGSGTANTIDFIRCQFNGGSASGDSCVLFTNYASPDGIINFTDCYSDCSVSGGFIKVDTSCTAVRRVAVIGCKVFEGTSGAIVDTGGNLIDLIVSNNVFGVDLSLSGITATIVGNVWNGSATATLDAMGGVFSCNTVNTIALSGEMTGLVIDANSYTTLTNTATGTYGGTTKLGFRLPTDGSISAPASSGSVTLMSVTSSSSAIHVGGSASTFVFDCPTNGMTAFADDTYDLGSSAKRWGSVYSHFIKPTRVTLSSTGFIEGIWTSGTASIASVSSVSGVIHLGASNPVGIISDTGHGFWGHSPPSSQPAAPVTLADVIEIIRGCGLSA